MSHTVVSSKYQVVIPKQVRERVHLRPGQKLAVIVRGRDPLEESEGKF